MLDDLKIREFNEANVRTLNHLQLAIIGDGVYEIFIRTYILAENEGLSANKIHRKAISYVKAQAQSNIMHNLEEYLTEEELRIYKRGRNQKSHTSPKNADIIDYKCATGFEALVGYLYLKEDKERLEYIVYKGISIIESNM